MAKKQIDFSEMSVGAQRAREASQPKKVPSIDFTSMSVGAQMKAAGIEPGSSTEEPSKKKVDTGLSGTTSFLDSSFKAKGPLFDSKEELTRLGKIEGALTPEERAQRAEDARQQKIAEDKLTNYKRSVIYDAVSNAAGVAGISKPFLAGIADVGAAATGLVGIVNNFTDKEISAADYVIEALSGKKDVISGLAKEATGGKSFSELAYEASNEISGLSGALTEKTKKEVGISNEDLAKGPIDLMLEGKLADGLKVTAVEVVKAIPQVIVQSALAPEASAGFLTQKAATFATTSAMALGQNIAQDYAKDKDISVEDALKSMAKSAIEGLTETIFRADINAVKGIGASLAKGDTSVAKELIKGVIEKEGKEAAKQEIARGFSKPLAKMLSKGFEGASVVGKFNKGGVEEGIEEVMSTVGSFIVDRVADGKWSEADYNQLLKDSGNAFALGYSSGGFINGVTAQLSMKKLTDEQKAKVEKFNEVANNEELSAEVRKIARDKANDIIRESADQSYAGYDELTRLPVEKRVQAFSLLSDINAQEESKKNVKDVDMIAAIDKSIEAKKAEYDYLLTGVKPSTQPVVEKAPATEEEKQAAAKIQTEEQAYQEELAKADKSWKETIGMPSEPMKVSSQFSIRANPEELGVNNAHEPSPNMPLEVDKKADGKKVQFTTKENPDALLEGDVYTINQGNKKFATILSANRNGVQEYYVPELPDAKPFANLDDAKFAVQEKLTGVRVKEIERSGINRLRADQSIPKADIVIRTDNGQEVLLDPVVKKSIQNAVKAFKSVSSAPVYLYRNTEDFKKGVAKELGSESKALESAGQVGGGFFTNARNEDSIHINLANISATTVAHELFHGTVVNVARQNPSAFAEMRDAIINKLGENDLINVSDENGKLVKLSAKEYLDRYSKQYSPEQQAEEFLSELTGLLATDMAKLKDPTIWETIKLAIRNLVKTANIDIPIFEKTANINDTVKFFTDLSKSLKTGQEIKLEKLKIQNDKEAVKQGTAVQATNGESKIAEEDESLRDSVSKTVTQRRKGNELGKKKRKLSAVAAKAMAIEPTTPDDYALQYFINGGQVIRGSKDDTTEKDTVFSLFSKSRMGGAKESVSEMRARVRIMAGRDAGGLSISEIAEKIFAEYQQATKGDVGIDVNTQYDFMDFKNAVESAILGHKSDTAMANTLLESKNKPAEEGAIALTEEQELEALRIKAEAQALGLTEEEFMAKLAELQDTPEMQAAEEAYAQALDMIDDEDFAKLYKLNDDDIAKIDELMAGVESTEGALDDKLAEQKKIVRDLEAERKKVLAAIDKAGKEKQLDIEGKAPIQEQLFATDTKSLTDRLQSIETQLTAAKADVAATQSAIDFQERGTVDMFEQETKPEVKAEETKPAVDEAVPESNTEKIEDFGEKIGGAKKDLVKKALDSYNMDLEVDSNVKYSQLLPLLNYNALIKEGALTQDGAILIDYIKGRIPTKPKNYNKSRWISQMIDARQTIYQILNDDMLDVQNLIDNLSEEDLVFKNTFRAMKGIGFPQSGLSLGNYFIREFGANNFAVVNGFRVVGDRHQTFDEAAEALRELLSANKSKTKETKFAVWERRSTKENFIGKKVGSNVITVMGGFKTSAEAYAYIAENRPALEEIWKEMRQNPDERRGENKTRVGEDYRKGRNISGEEFGKTFGFRGVEFGNWVNNKERQQSVNEAYDALMDLSTALGISPNAISLGGKLGLAFGARGSGKAMAHYESTRTVINLTKTKGAGSLAHEWWHALDNYFASPKSDSFITERTKDSSIQARQEVKDAFANVVRVINKETGIKSRSSKLDKARTSEYWSTDVEMTARSFESFVVSKLAETGNSNDYLANFKELTDWSNGGSVSAESYPYPSPEEKDVISKAYQELFNTIQERQEGAKTILFQKQGISVSKLSDKQQASLDKSFEDTNKFISDNFDLPSIAGDDKNIVVKYQAIALRHGSPYNFDKFTLNKVGAGEGRQVYGHGLYFSEEPGIAQSYSVQNQGNKLKNLGILDKVPESKRNQLYELMQKSATTSKDIKKWLDDNKGFFGLSIPARVREQVMKTFGERAVYTVKVESQDFRRFKWIEWDKPLSKDDIYTLAYKANKILPLMKQAQLRLIKTEKTKPKDVFSKELNESFNLINMAEAIGNAAASGRFSNMTGGEFYEIIAKSLKSQANASRLLYEFGYDGVKVPIFFYTSGGKDVGKSNYVVFNDGNIKIIGKQVSKFQKQGISVAPTYKYQMNEMFKDPERLITDIKNKYDLRTTLRERGKVEGSLIEVERKLADNMVVNALSRMAKPVFKGIGAVENAALYKSGKGEDVRTKDFLMYAPKWVGDKLKKATLEAIQGTNKYSAQAGRVASSLIGNLAKTESLQEARKKKEGLVKDQNNEIAMLSKSLNGMIGFSKQSLMRVHSLLDPEAFLEEEEAVQSPKDLDLQELRLYNVLRDMNDFIHEWHFQNEFIDAPTYEKHKGKYFARMYEEIERKEFADLHDAIDKMPSGADFRMFKERKDFSEIELTLMNDPIYITSRRFATMIHNKAIIEFSNAMANDPAYKFYSKLEDVPEENRSGFKQLGTTGGGKRYGELTGKYVPITIYEELRGTTFANKYIAGLYDVLRGYDGMPTRQYLKKSLTVYQPVTRSGNITSNFAFAWLAGVDPFTMMKNRVRAKDSLDNYDEWAKDLAAAGVLGTDIISIDLAQRKKQAEKGKPNWVDKIFLDKYAKGEQALVDKLVKLGASADKIEKAKQARDKVVAKAIEGDKYLVESYGRTDDISKIALYRSLVDDYGKDRDEAAKIVAESMQNYTTVGKAYQFFSKMPLIGNPFVKFSSDLARIISNGLVKRPLYTASFLGMLYGMHRLLSGLSGEPEEEREARVSRPFIPKIPLGFTDIPLVWKIGKYEFNVAKFISPYYVYDAGYRSNTIAELSKFAPLQLSYEDKVGVISDYLPVFSDVLTAPLAQLILDKDFKSLPIADTFDSIYTRQTVTEDEAALNRLNYFGKSYFSPVWGMVSNLISAAKGEPDMYGRRRDIGSSVLNNFIKVQEFESKDVQRSIINQIKYIDSEYKQIKTDITSRRNNDSDRVLEIMQSDMSDERKREKIDKIDEDFRTYVGEMTEKMQILTEKRAEPWNRLYNMQNPQKND